MMIIDQKGLGGLKSMWRHLACGRLDGLPGLLMIRLQGGFRDRQLVFVSEYLSLRLLAAFDKDRILSLNLIEYVFLPVLLAPMSEVFGHSSRIKRALLVSDLRFPQLLYHFSLTLHLQSILVLRGRAHCHPTTPIIFTVRIHQLFRFPLNRSSILLRL